MCHRTVKKFWLWSSWGCVQVLIMTLAILLATIATPIKAHNGDFGIDLLSELNLYNMNISHRGVIVSPGFHNNTMAFRLQTSLRRLIMPEASYHRIVEYIKSSPEFTLTALVRQEKGNSGSIISFSYGPNRYLELESSGKRAEVRFHYTYQTPAGDMLLHTEMFSYQLADDTWHKVALSVSGPEIQLIIDCHPLYKRVNHFIPDRNFSASNIQLFVGQRNLYNHSMFKGYIESAHVIAKPHGYLKQCPHMHEQCPTCAEFSLLQHTIDELEKKFDKLAQRLVATEKIVSHLQECECRISCKINGTTKEDGAEWRDGCKVCKCESGSIICEPPKCEPVTCKYPTYINGSCCPICKKHCYIRGKYFDHGEFYIEQCNNCTCDDGSMRCVKIECPKLNCSPENIIKVKDECCSVCKGDDYCSKGHACHTNATCLNLTTKYTCTCRQGFQGDGFHCSDVDECTAARGSAIGNHCRFNTQCVNVPGSYRCECLSGYRRLDRYNCVEIDECASGQHSCHENANCINTQGSYHCECKEGYSGDGYDCKPVCNQTCLHGGQCSAPNVCTCRMGFIGAACEQDFDECASGLHNCKESSECINMPGWYYCHCKSGYQSLGSECYDIDECERGKHSCHPTATCVNTIGHFECHCPEDKANSECSLNCMFEDSEVPDGSVVSPRNQPCKKCTCRKGVISCEEPKCNCSEWKRSVGRELCCPQCDPNESCRHQELDHVIFKSGERWIYQCQTCECLYGEFDCWKLECPPLMCDNPLPLKPGDCCQRCPDDPCNYLGNLTNSLGHPCTYKGHQYSSGQISYDLASQCTKCDCKDGQLFCSVDYSCTDSDSKPYKVPTAITRTTAFHNCTKDTTNPFDTTSKASARAPKRRMVRQSINNKKSKRQRNHGG
ncbi:protein kinase C-binding protein NELL1-like isoform X3 [Hermetia illucens]|nr:protein kinase C-binding protein NELL1-like isoform X3 [Hermetia illucens]